MAQALTKNDVTIGPVFTWPNAVTFARILAVPLFLALAAAVRERPGLRLYAAVLFYAVALSDWLDGFLARRLRKESTLGKVLDPVADKILVVAGSLFLASPLWAGPRVSPLFALLVVLRDLLIVGGAFFLRRKDRGYVPRARPLGKAATFVNLLALGFFVVGAPPLPEALLTGWIVLASALLFASGGDYLQAARTEKAGPKKIA